MHDPEPLTAASFWSGVHDERAVANEFVESRAHCRKAWAASGLAVELALKAIIMQRHRWNQWPSRTPGNRYLFTHDLRELFKLSGLQFGDIPKELRASFATVFQWSREDDYDFRRMKRVQARSMHKAVFGYDGVVEWLKTL